MCNYNGVCPISNGCGYYQFAYCCQRRQCQPCCNRTRLLPKAAANTHDYSCLSKKCKAKNDATNMVEATNNDKENIVCPKSVTGVCKSRCVAPCSKTRKMHYPSGPLQRRKQTNSICCAAQSCPVSSTTPTPTTCNKTENNVVEVTKTKKKSKLSKSKAKKIESNEECACEEPKTVEDGLWFQCNVPVRVNVPNLMFMQPSLNGNENNSIASGSMHSTGSNSSKSRNALSVVQRNQSQPIGTDQATPFFSVYFKQLQECNESPKNFNNRTPPNNIQTQTYPPEIPMDIPSIKSSLSPKKRICKCVKRRHKTPLTSSPATQIAQKSLSSYESDEFPLACKTYIPSVNNDYNQSPNTSHSESNKSNQQNESSQDNTAEGDLNEMVQRDISDLHRICKCLERKTYCAKATARRSCVSLYENTNSETSDQKQTISQSLNNLPKTCRCTTMKNETSQMTCNKSTSSGNGTASPTIKSSLKIRTCEISPSSSCNSSRWQPVVQLIEDIVAESTSKSSKLTNSRSASTLTTPTPTPSCCQSCQKCGKRRFKKKTTKTALRGGSSSTDNRQYLSREHLLAALDNNECRLKDALDNRPVVLVPYQVTAAHESMPVCESRNIFTMCLATPSRRELSCSQMKCNEHKHKQADDDDNDNDEDDDEDNDNGEQEYNHETPMHTTAILMPRPLSSDSNIRPPSYSCNQPNRHEMNNYAKTVLYETTTVCSLENLIQACSRPPSNIISCGLMAKERFPDNVSQAKQMRNSNHSSLYNYQSTMDNYTNEVASVRNDCNHFNQMPAINSNNQCKMCPCCSNSCYRYGPQMMMPPASVQHIPVGVYQQTAQKYGFDIMDSFFRNQPAQANCCQMQYNQVRQNAGCYRYPTDINNKDMRSTTQRCAEPYLKRTPTQKSLALNQCPCTSNYSGHYFR